MVVAVVGGAAVVVGDVADVVIVGVIVGGRRFR